MKIKIGNKTFEVSKEALESNPEEVTIEFDGVLRTQDEESTFIENHKKDARKEGVEIAVKQHREKYGFTGRTIEKLIEAVEKSTLDEAKLEPNEQLKKIQDKLDEKEEALQKALQKVGDQETQFKNFKNETRLDRKLDSYIPENTLLPKEDMKVILKTKLSFGVDEDGNDVVLDAMGNILKDDTTANPRNPKDVVSNFFKDNQSYLKAVEGGSGEGDSGKNGKKKSIDDFITEQSEKGLKVNSPEFNEALKGQIEAGLVEVD